jgi:hypothetical protein
MLFMAKQLIEDGVRETGVDRIGINAASAIEIVETLSGNEPPCPV